MARRHNLDDSINPVNNKPNNPRDYAKVKRLNALMKGYERA